MGSQTVFILLCVPEPLPTHLPLRTHEDAVIAALNTPPRSRRSSWFLRPNGDHTPVRTGLGLSREDPFTGIRVTVAWNGSIVCEEPLETSAGSWGHDPINGVPVINCLAIIEPVVQVFALAKHLSQYIDKATHVQVRLVLRNASRVILTPFRADSYAIKLKHFDSFPNIIKRVEQDEIAILPHSIPVNELDDAHARDVAVDFFSEVGFDMTHVKLPFFDDKGKFDLK